MSNPNIVIIGASHAAAEAAPLLRKKGWNGGIIVIGDEPGIPYQRPPLSKKFLQGDLEGEKLAIKKAGIYEKSDVELRLGEKVVSLDRENRTTQLESGDIISYEKLILATGARPRLLPVDGANANNIFYLRTLNDVEKIKHSVQEGKHFLIVGAGYIGLEVAATLTKLNCKVKVVEAMSRVLERVTSPEVSEFYQELHKKNGVEIILGRGLTEFEHSDTNSYAVLDDGEKLGFDAAIVGIGVIPNVSLAEEAGLECSNGIVVNRFCQTSDSNIYAVGDVSNFPSEIYERSMRLESVPNAVAQSKTVVDHIMGDALPYNEVPWFWSDQYDVKLQTAGVLQGYDQTVKRSIDENKWIIFYLKAGQLIAADCINTPAEFMAIKKVLSLKPAPDIENLKNTEIPLSAVF